MLPPPGLIDKRDFIFGIIREWNLRRDPQAAAISNAELPTMMQLTPVSRALRRNQGRLLPADFAISDYGWDIPWHQGPAAVQAQVHDLLSQLTRFNQPESAFLFGLLKVRNFVPAAVTLQLMHAGAALLVTTFYWKEDEEKKEHRSSGGRNMAVPA
jgi:hypothetical protein